MTLEDFTSCAQIINLFTSLNNYKEGPQQIFTYKLIFFFNIQGNGARVPKIKKNFSIIKYFLVETTHACLST